MASQGSVDVLKFTAVDEKEVVKAFKNITENMEKMLKLQQKLGADFTGIRDESNRLAQSIAAINTELGSGTGMAGRVGGIKGLVTQLGKGFKEKVNTSVLEVNKSLHETKKLVDDISKKTSGIGFGGTGGGGSGGGPGGPGGGSVPNFVPYTPSLYNIPKNAPIVSPIPRRLTDAGTPESAQKTVAPDATTYTRIKKELVDIVGSNNKLLRTTREVRNENGDILKLSVKETEQVKKMTIQGSKWKSMLMGVRERVNGIVKGSTRIVGIWNTWNKGLIFASRLFKPIVKYMKDVLLVGGEFQQSTVEIGEMLNVVEGGGKKAESSINAVIDAVKEQGSTTEHTYRQVAEGTQQYVQMGFRAEKISRTLGEMADFATTRHLTFAKALDISTKTLRQFGLDVNNLAQYEKNLTRVHDVLNKTHLTTSATVTDLGQAFKYVGPIAKEAGFELEETAAHLGILANVGIRAGQAGRMLRSVYTRLAAGVTTVQKGLSILNDTTGSNIKLTHAVIDESGQLVMRQRDTKEVMFEMADAYEDLADSEKNRVAYLIAGQRGMSSFLALMDQGRSGIEDMTGTITQSTGTTAALVEKIRATYINTVKIVKSAAEAIKITIFDFIEAPMRNINKSLRDVLLNLGKGLEDMRDMVAKNGFNRDTIRAGLQNIVALIGPDLQKLSDLIVKAIKDVSMVAGEIITSIFVDTFAKEDVSGGIVKFLHLDELTSTLGSKIIEIATPAGAEFGKQFIYGVSNALTLGLPSAIKRATEESRAAGTAETRDVFGERVKPGLTTPLTAFFSNEYQERRQGQTDFARDFFSKQSPEAIQAMIGGTGPFEQQLPEWSRKIAEEVLRQQGITQGGTSGGGGGISFLERFFGGGKTYAADVGPGDLGQQFSADNIAPALLAKLGKPEINEGALANAIVTAQDQSEKAGPTGSIEALSLENFKYAYESAKATLTDAAGEIGEKFVESAEKNGGLTAIGELVAAPFKKAQNEQRKLDADRTAAKRELRLSTIEDEMANNDATLQWLNSVKGVKDSMADVRALSFEIANADLRTSLQISELGADIDTWLLEPINEYLQKLADIKNSTSSLITSIQQGKVDVEQEFLGLSEEDAVSRQKEILKARVEDLKGVLDITQTAAEKSGLFQKQADVLKELASLSEGTEQKGYAGQYLRTADDAIAAGKKAGEIETERVKIQERFDKESLSNLQKQLQNAEGGRERLPILQELLEISKRGGDDNVKKVLTLERELSDARGEAAKEEVMLQKEQLEILKVIAENTRLSNEKLGLEQYRSPGDTDVINGGATQYTGMNTLGPIQREMRNGIPYFTNILEKSSQFIQGYSADGVPYISNVDE